MTELLPCPFCGHKPTLQRWEDALETVHVSWLVKCSGGCLASTGTLEEDPADAVEAWNRRAAYPVQAGIDPLVAEIIAKLEATGGKGQSGQTKIGAAALLRSQAERIAALEVERDALAMRRADEVLCFATAVLHGDDEHREWLLAAARAFIDYEPLPPPNGKGRAIAAESLLAEAREALEEAAEYVAFNHFASDRHRAVELVHKFRATLSRLKPGEKGDRRAAREGALVAADQHVVANEASSHHSSETRRPLDPKALEAQHAFNLELLANVVEAERWPAIIAPVAARQLREAAKALHPLLPTSAESVAGYCTDCESHVTIHNGRCGCGSGRVIASLPASGAVEAEPLRYCGYCKTWNSKPCGNGCVWTPDMPTKLPAAPTEGG